MRNHSIIANRRRRRSLRRRRNSGKPLSILLTNATAGALKALEAYPDIDQNIRVKPTGKNGNLIKNDVIALIQSLTKSEDNGES